MNFLFIILYVPILWAVLVLALRNKRDRKKMELIYNLVKDIIDGVGELGSKHDSALKILARQDALLIRHDNLLSRKDKWDL